MHGYGWSKVLFENSLIHTHRHGGSSRTTHAAPAPLQHSQFSSQHNVSRPLNAFGSTPHLPRDFYNYESPGPGQQGGQQGNPQAGQPGFQYQYRDIEQEFARPQFYLHDSPAPPQRRTWAQHAQLQQDGELRGWQVRLALHGAGAPAGLGRWEGSSR